MRLSDSLGVILNFIGLGCAWVLALAAPATVETLVLACIAGFISLVGLGILTQN